MDYVNLKHIHVIANKQNTLCQKNPEGYPVEVQKRCPEETMADMREPCPSEEDSPAKTFRSLETKGLILDSPHQGFILEHQRPGGDGPCYMNGAG